MLCNLQQGIKYVRYGNLKKAISVFDKVKDSEKFRHFFKDWKDKWYFPTPSETEKLLKEIGYSNVKVYLREAMPQPQIKSILSISFDTEILFLAKFYLCNCCHLMYSFCICKFGDDMVFIS